MRTRKTMKHLLRLLLLAIIGSLTVILFACKAKKKTVDKKVEKVSELVKKDIKKSTETEMDVSTIEISSENIIKTSDETSITFEPTTDDRPITIVHDQDTLTVSNAKITFENKKSEKGKQTKTNTKTDKEIASKTKEKDKTKIKSESEAKQKTKQKDVKGGFPWWILIVAGVVFLIWKFGGKVFKKLPGL